VSDGSDTTRRVEVKGELDVANVPARLKRSADWFENGGETVIDLADVTRADSAGVALLLEWIRDAEREGATLNFINAPEQMRAIISFCGLDEVIALNDDGSRAA
tara:strand:+ start:783 stop:1094 length:312 start_codon:yes stop_codon:yes gene_type:complete